MNKELFILNQLNSKPEQLLAAIKLSNIIWSDNSSDYLVYIQENKKWQKIL
jgi:hypothetical protein